MEFKRKLLIFVLVFVAGFMLFTGVALANAQQMGEVNGSVVNVRSASSTSSSIVGQLSRGHRVSVLEKSNDWYKIESGNLVGWVYGPLIDLENQFASSGVIIGSNVNVRTGPSTSNNVVVRLWSGATVDVIGRSGQWYNIRTSYGTEGWVFENLISVRNTTVSRGAEVRTAGVASTIGQQISDYSRRFLGIRYVYGGMSTNGFDCSGFVRYVLNNFGINIARVASDQARHGTWVGRNDLIPGDLVFFDTREGRKSYINHVGIYIGNSQFIHASSGRSSVIISNLDGFYSQNYMTARRVR